MKTILLIILLIGGLAYPQTFISNDSVRTHAQTIREHAQDILDLEGTTVDVELMQQQLNALTELVQSMDGRLNNVEDSIVSHNTRILALQGGGGTGVPEPTTPTDFLATPVSVSQVNLSFTSPTSVFDSIYIYRDNVLITVLDSGVTTYSNTGLSETTTYTYNARSIKRINGLALFSDYSNSDTATTFTSEPPAPEAGIDYYITANASGSGDGTSGSPFTLAQALALNVTSKVFSLGIGVYPLSSSINFNKANNTWIGTVHPTDEKNKNADGTNSTVLTVTAGSQSTVTMGASGVTLKKMVIEQTESRYLFYVSAANCTTDSVAFKYTIDAGSSSHLIQVNGSGDDFLMTRCWVNDGPRTSLWVRWSNDPADNVIIEYTYFTAASNHNAIQFMPSTETSNVTWQNGVEDSSPSPTCKGAVIRYCTFENNPYSDLLVFRHCDSVKVYGNLMINSGKINITDQFPTTGYVFDTTSVAWFCYNTIISNGAFAGAFGNQNGNGIIQKNNIYYNSSNWYSENLIHRYECGQPSTTGQSQVNLRHVFDYNMYYVAPNPTGSTWHSFMGSNSCGYSSYTFTQWKALGYDTHSTNNVLPSFVNLAGGDYNVTTSNMSGNADNIPADVKAYTMDGEVREATSIGMNNKK